MTWNFEVPAVKVKVVGKDDWITANGDVDWPSLKDAAARCVCYLIAVISLVRARCALQAALDHRRRLVPNSDGR